MAGCIHLPHTWVQSHSNLVLWFTDQAVMDVWNIIVVSSPFNCLCLANEYHDKDCTAASTAGVIQQNITITGIASYIQAHCY